MGAHGTTRGRETPIGMGEDAGAVGAEKYGTKLCKDGDLDGKNLKV